MPFLLAAFSIAISFVLLVGCGGSGHPRLYQVSGELFVNDEPATGAQIILHPENTDPALWKVGYPSAIVQPDGKFEIESFEERGAPAGNYKVIAIWTDATDVEDTEAPPPMSKIDPQYSSPESSPWSVVVQKKRNKLDRFEVK